MPTQTKNSNKKSSHKKFEIVSLNIDSITSTYEADLINKLQKIHGIGSEAFWRTIFSHSLRQLLGICLYHYCDFENGHSSTNCKPTFYVCNSFQDSYEELNTSNGVQCLQSLYNAPPDASIPTTLKTSTPAADNNEKRNSACFLMKCLYKIARVVFNKKNATLGIYYSNVKTKTRLILNIKSLGKIRNLTPHIQHTNTNALNHDIPLRDKLFSQTENSNKMDNYLARCLKIYFPTMLLENFNDKFIFYSQKLSEYKKLKHLLSESFISGSESLLLLAIAKEKGIKIIGNEHGVTMFYIYKHSRWDSIAKSVDIMLSNYNIPNSASIPTGSQHDLKIKHHPNNDLIIYLISLKTKWCYSASFDYLRATGIESASRAFCLTNKLISNTDSHIKQKIRIKRHPFEAHPCIETYKYRNENNIKELPTNDSAKMIIGNCKLVLADTMSSTTLTALASNIPTVALLDKEALVFCKDHLNIYDDLIEAKIIFYDPISAAKHLNSVYDNVELWWKSDHTQRLRQRFLHTYVFNGDAMIDCLLLMASGKKYTVDSLKAICTNWREREQARIVY